MDCSLPGSSVHGIFQAIVLEWIAITFSRGSYWPREDDQPRQHIKKQRHYFASKGLSSQSYGFSNSHVWMWELDHKEGWAPKNWCFQIENPLDCKEIKPVNPKGNQPWMFTGRTHAEVEPPLIWPLDVKSWLIGKDPDAGKDWRQKEKGGSRGWDSWIASPTQWTWIWASSGR